MKGFKLITSNILGILLTIFPVINFSSCSDGSDGPLAPSSDDYTLIDFDPAWSSGGDRIAYVHSDLNNEFTGIYVMNSNGSGLTKLVPDFARNPDWSPDNQWIAFAQFENIYKINLQGDSIVQLTNSTGNSFPKWSSDNSLIAFCNCSDANSCVVQTMNPDGSQINLIDFNAKYPEWTDGNSSLIYFKPNYVNGSQSGDTLTRYFFSDSSTRNIIFLGGEDHKVNMSPVFAGETIIFCSMNSTGSTYIYKMESDGSNLVRLTISQGFSPDYSFANKNIVYTNRNKGNGRLWTMNKDGSNQVQLNF